MKNDVQHMQGVFFQLTIEADSAHMQYIIPHLGHIKFKSKRVGLKKRKRREEKNVTKEIEYRNNPIGLHQGIIAHH